jgi:PAT family beta-lactamase induction signal transducer AmpG
MAHSASSPRRTPWLWVPTAYFAEGVPYVVVNTVSVIIFKKMGVSNSLNAFATSFLYLPWVVKMLWGPLVDTRATKRRWIVGTQFALAAGFAMAALALRSHSFFAFSIAVFALIAFASATHDIAVDGFYMLGLARTEQAFFAGVRSTAYRVAMLFASGGLVVLAGRIERMTGDVPLSWIASLSAAGVLFAALALFHAWYLPRPASDGARKPESGGAAGSFSAVFRSYFTQPRIAAVLAFILFYRLGEAMLVKMTQPFLLDPAVRGGLGLSTESIGIIYGTAGTCFLLAGGVTGGVLIARFGFGRCIWPMALAMNVPDLGYLYMAWARPPLPWVCGLVALEQFGYGLGFTGFTVFLMYIAREPFKTAHYAISTGLMALGMMLPGAVSGFLQERLGYPSFFAIVCLLTLPGMLSIAFIPAGVGAEGKGAEGKGAEGKG